MGYKGDFRKRTVPDAEVKRKGKNMQDESVKSGVQGAAIDGGQVMQFAQQKKHKPDDGIAEVKTYVNLQGHMVKAFSPIDGKPKQYHGMLTVSDGRQQMQFEFPFPKGLTLREVFCQFETMAKAAIDEVKKEQAKQRLIMPASAVPPAPNAPLAFPGK